MTIEQELQIRKALADKISAIPEAGFVIPAPLFCNDTSDFWATLDSVNSTKDEIELTNIAACWITPKSFSDDLTSSKPDSPLVLLSYEIYLFRQYDLERADETLTPVLFDSQMLKMHNKFITAWLGIKEAFQGIRVISQLDSSVFAVRQTTSVVQDEFINNKAVCKYVPKIIGFSVTLTATCRIKLVDC